MVEYLTEYYNCLFVYLPMLLGAQTNGVERQNDKWITNWKIVPVWKEMVVTCFELG